MVVVQREGDCPRGGVLGEGVSELFEEVALEELGCVPAAGRVVMEEVLEEVFDLRGLEVLVVVGFALFLELKEGQDLLRFWCFERGQFLWGGSAFELQHLRNLIDGILPGQQGPPTVQLIDQTPQTPHVTLLPIASTP